MKVYKTTSEIEKKFSQVEKLMRELNLAIDWQGEFHVYDGTNEAILWDTDSKDKVSRLPRATERERMVVNDYRKLEEQTEELK